MLPVQLFITRRHSLKWTAKKSGYLTLSVFCNIDLENSDISSSLSEVTKIRVRVSVDYIKCDIEIKSDSSNLFVTRMIIDT